MRDYSPRGIWNLQPATGFVRCIRGVTRGFFVITDYTLGCQRWLILALVDLDSVGRWRSKLVM